MSNQAVINEPEARRRGRGIWRISINGYRRALVFVLLLTPIVIRVWFLSQVPELSAPFDVDEFCRIDVPLEQNAFDHYSEAHRMGEAIEANRASIGVSLPFDDCTAVYNNGWGAATDALEEWLHDSGPALSEWRRGTEMTKALCVPVRQINADTSLAVVQTLRRFARIASCEGIRSESQKEFAAAADWYIAILRCSRHSIRRGCVIGRLIGCTIQSMGSERLICWSEASEITVDQLRRVQDEVRLADRMSVATSETLKVEYLCEMNTFKSADWWQSCDLISENATFRRIMTTNPDLNPLPGCLKASYWMLGEPLRTQRLLRHVLTNQLREVDKPLSERSPSVASANELLFQVSSEAMSTSKELDAAEIDRAIQGSFLAKDLFHILKGLDISIHHERARQALLEIALAAQIFRREHGEFPDDLSALLPNYFETWPLDPCDNTGQSIRYRKIDATSAIVWSVGRNLIDDDGNIGTENFEYRAPDYGIRLKVR